MGTPDYADKILQELIDDSAIEVVAVFTQPDKPVGRKKVLTAPPTKIRANEANIPVYQPLSLKKERFEAEIEAMNADYIVVAAFGQILPKSILDIAPCINLHASLLPDFRGASPIQQSLLAGHTQTGVTAMLMDVGMDTGDIITTKSYDIPKDMLCFELFDALTDVAAELTLKVLHKYDSFEITAQDESKATYCKKIQKADGLVNFDNAELVYNTYRAFTPWPGIFLESGLKLKKVELSKESGSFSPGKILSVEKHRIEVGCTKGSLYIYSVQPNSKKEMDIMSYLNGRSLGLDDTLA
jgi:methionyl-tRNA formyltransferase